MKITLPLLAACALVAWTLPARAEDHAAAEEAFREGRRLLDAGQLEQACAKLAESQKLEPAAGTLLNLADCYERRGLVASAADTYKEAAVASGLRGRSDWEQFALIHYQALRPRVPRLTLRVTSPAPGLTVARDGRAVAVPANAVEETLDPGSHTVEATAPGRNAWRTTFVVGPGDARTVDIPALAPTAAAAEPAPAPTSGGRQRPVGFVAGGVGVAALAFGAVAGLIAINGRSDAESKCPSYPTRGTAEGTAANDRAQDWATGSTIAFVAGGVLVAAGVTLVVTSPRTTGMASRVVATPGGLELRGTF